MENHVALAAESSREGGSSTLVQVHPFAHLGKAPYRLLYVASFPSPSLAEANPDAYSAACRALPRDVPLGICNHCGMTLMHNFVCQSADGKKFVVGADCVFKTNDPGKFVARVEVERKKIANAANRARAQVRDAAAIAEWDALIASDDAAKLAGVMVPGRPWVSGETVSLLDSMKRLWAMCGAAGRKRTLKTLKEHIASVAKAGA